MPNKAIHYSNEEKLMELERELSMRRNVYPRWIAAGKISASTAELRLAVLEQIAEDYRAQIAQQCDLLEMIDNLPANSVTHAAQEEAG